MTDIRLTPGYEIGDGSMDGAQQVDGEWYHPVMDCDSLQWVVDSFRAQLALMQATSNTGAPSGHGAAPAPIPLDVMKPGPEHKTGNGKCFYACIRHEFEGELHLMWGLQEDPYNDDEYWLPVTASALPTRVTRKTPSTPAASPSETTPP